MAIRLPVRRHVRIFHLVPNLNYGGLQEVVRGLALCQSQSGHSVTIGCWTNASNHPEVERELENARVSILYLRRANDGGLAPWDPKCLFRGLKERLGLKNADILHVHNPFSYYIYGALAARAAGGTKVVNTVHATAMFDQVTKGFGRKSRVKFWTAAILSNSLVSVCQEVEAYMRRKFVLPGKRLSVVENGIDLARFLAVPPRSSRKEIVFGAVGRMSMEKNHRLLIEAFALARRKHDHIRLRLLGGGPREPELRELVHNLGLDDEIEFCGFSNDVPRFLAGIDVFALPSNTEGLPLSLLEAIASGLPVVATAVGGVPRVVENTQSGWVCPPRNVDAFVEAMEAAISCPDLRERGERARHLVAEQYSAERMSRDYERIYRGILQ
jgi:glycosyltransferase involved in cell wall biosynthesis